jgi:hypothetical protein
MQEQLLIKLQCQQHVAYHLLPLQELQPMQPKEGLIHGEYSNAAYCVQLPPGRLPSLVYPSPVLCEGSYEQHWQQENVEEEREEEEERARAEEVRQQDLLLINETMSIRARTAWQEEGRQRGLALLFQRSLNEQ